MVNLKCLSTKSYFKNGFIWKALWENSDKWTLVSQFRCTCTVTSCLIFLWSPLPDNYSVLVASNCQNAMVAPLLRHTVLLWAYSQFHVLLCCPASLARLLSSFFFIWTLCWRSFKKFSPLCTHLLLTSKSCLILNLKPEKIGKCTNKNHLQNTRATANIKASLCLCLAF